MTAKTSPCAATDY